MRKVGYDAAVNALPCEHFEGDPEREGFATCLGCTTDAVLAAVLGVCEVREQEGLRLDWVDQNGGQAEDWENNRSGWARNAVRLHQHCEATRPDYPARASLIRRLVIVTPAEQVDTEGAPA